MKWLSIGVKATLEPAEEDEEKKHTHNKNKMNGTTKTPAKQQKVKKIK